MKKEKFITFDDSDGIVYTHKLRDPDPNYFLSQTTFKVDSLIDEDV